MKEENTTKNLGEENNGKEKKGKFRIEGYEDTEEMG